MLVCVHAKLLQSCLTLCDPMDCTPPDSSVYGILQARMLEWVAIPFSWRSSRPRDQTRVSCIAGGLFTVWATWEANDASWISSIHHFSLLLLQEEEIWQAQHEYLFLTKTKAKDHLLLIQTNSKIVSIKIITWTSTFGGKKMTLGRNYPIFLEKVRR